MSYIRRKAINAAVMFSIFSFVGLGIGVLFNFIDSEIDKYQTRQIAKVIRAEEETRRNLSGNEVLNVSSLVVGQSEPGGEVRTKFARGEDVPFVFCREPLIDVVAGLNVRSYYKDEGDREVQSGQRTLPEGILYENRIDNCPVLNLRAENLPEEDGIYSFCQTLEFVAWGYNKNATYCSDNKFELGG